MDTLDLSGRPSTMMLDAQTKTAVPNRAADAPSADFRHGVAIAVVDSRGEIERMNGPLPQLIGDARLRVGASLIECMDARDRPTLRAAILGVEDATFAVRVRPDAAAGATTLACTCTPIGAGRACVAFVSGYESPRNDDRERRQFQFMADSASDAFFLVDDASTIVYANRVAHAERGYAPGELIGRSTHDVSPAYPADRVHQLFDDTAGGAAFRLSHVHRRKDGSTFPVESSVNHLELDGRVYLFSAARDVTAQHAAEQSIRAERERMAMVVEQSNVGVWFAPLPLGEFTWDAKVKEHFFLPPDADANAEIFYARMHPDDREPTAAAIARSAADRVPYDVVYRTVAPDGSAVKSIRALGHTHYDGDGTPVMLDGLTFDVTCQVRDAAALRESEARVRESEERLRLAAGIAQMGLYDVDFAADAIVVNDAARAIYGWDASPEPTYATLRAARHPDDAETTAAAIEAARLPGGTGRYEVEQRILRPDGTIRWIRIRGLAVFDAGPDRVATRVVGAFLDITDQKESDLRRERLLAAEHSARVEAEAAARLKDEFLTTLSHELRTPLNAIIGWATLLRRGDKSGDPAIAKGLETIDRNARLQAQVISDLLDVRQIVAGSLTLDVADDVDLARVVRDVVDVVRPAAEAKSIGLEVAGADVPQSVRGDAIRLRQIAANLLTNAVKFTPRGGTVRVTIARFDDRDPHVALRVVDTGEGIDPAFLPHLFGRFRQADASTTRRHGGLGLGLAIVRSLVEMHGGSVVAESEGADCGASFTVRLPLRAQRPTVERTAPPTLI